MQHRYTLFDALDEATFVTVNGREVKRIDQGAASRTRTLVFDSVTGRESEFEFEDQHIVLDNEGYGDVFDAESRNPRLQFKRKVLVPLPLMPLAPVPPTNAQELITTCLTAMRNLFDDAQWRALGVNLNHLLDQARALGIPVPRQHD